MISFALNRLLRIPLVLVATFTIALLLVRTAPNGPFDPWRKLPAPVEAALMHDCDSEAPVIAQLLTAVSAWARFEVDGCTGRSLQDGAPVLEHVASALPVTLALSLLALLLAVGGGVLGGALLARMPAGVPDRAARASLAVVEAVPAFVLAPLAILGGALTLGLFPPARLAPSVAWVVPITTLALAFAATLARVTHTALRGPDMVARRRAELARGLHPRQVTLRALHLALLPVVANLGPVASGILMGGIAVELVFDLPGLGPLVIAAATARDYNLLLGGAITYAAVILVIGLLGDLLYGLLDPRVRGRR